MSKSKWIESPSRHHKISSEEEALRDTFLVAEKIGYHLLCASNQLLRAESPDVTACAALVREAVHKPEKDRANAVKRAQAAVLARQVDYVSTFTYYRQYRDAWLAIRPTLVAQLEAVVAPSKEAGARETSNRVDIDLGLNCEAIVNCIDGSDIAINEAARRRYNGPTEKHAQAGFQAVFDALVAEVSDQRWTTHSRLCSDTKFGADILRDIPVDNISSTEVSSEHVNLCALDSARADFERVFTWELTSACRDFNQTTRGTINDTQMSESLLAAADVTTMMHVEARRDSKMRSYGCSWRTLRCSLEQAVELFRKVAELLPAAVVEAAAIEDETTRRQAQNLCLFAARRLKENLKFVRDCNRYVDDRDPHFMDILNAVNRSHQSLVDRVISKALRTPTTQLREEPYMG